MQAEKALQDKKIPPVFLLGFVSGRGFDSCFTDIRGPPHWSTLINLEGINMCGIFTYSLPIH